jgi:hypothetical protein
MKKVLKFMFQDKEGFLSVVEKSNQYFTLVQKYTPKVIEIEKTRKLLISYELKEPKYQEVLVDISYEKSLIQWVYETLEKENNLYFKSLDDTLCVIIFAKK